MPKRHEYYRLVADHKCTSCYKPLLGDDQNYRNCSRCRRASMLLRRSATKPQPRYFSWNDISIARPTRKQVFARGK